MVIDISQELFEKEERDKSIPKNPAGMIHVLPVCSEESHEGWLRIDAGIIDDVSRGIESSENLHSLWIVGWGANNEILGQIGKKGFL